jgi:hypothetical protein
MNRMEYLQLLRHALRTPRRACKSSKRRSFFFDSAQRHHYSLF